MKNLCDECETVAYCTKHGCIPKQQAQWHQEEKRMIKNSIQFYSDSATTEVLRLSKDGIWANPNIPVDEAAKLVLEAIDSNIKVLVQKAVEEEREQCAKVCEELDAITWSDFGEYSSGYADYIRARGKG